MSTQGNTNQTSKDLSRRDFLVLGGAGASALAFGALGARVAAGQEVAGDTFSYGGHRVLVRWRNRHPLLWIDGDPVVVVDTNGTYRAAELRLRLGINPRGPGQEDDRQPKPPEEGEVAAWESGRTKATSQQTRSRASWQQSRP